MRLLQFPVRHEGPSLRASILQRIFLSLLMVFLLSAHWLQAFEVDPAKSEIVVGADALDETRFAAAELQKHLKLITGAEIPIVEQDEAAKGCYPFYVGIPYPGDEAPMKPEEARRHVGKEAAYLYGDARKGFRGVDFAVYDFLEDQLGVRWIEPGDAGIACEKQSPLQLKEGEAAWAPELLLREIRTSWRAGQSGTSSHKDDVQIFRPEYSMSSEEYDALAEDVAVWQKRMRMGRHDAPAYGHAFTTWWKKYGGTHPEYFALNKFGKREPLVLSTHPNATYAEDANPVGYQKIKMCAGSPALVRQIITNWLERGGPAYTKWVNVCENDGDHGYCEGEECLKLDAPLPGEKPMAHLTDRYVYLTNAVARAARKIDPEAGATMYAYVRYMDPPRREKVEPNVAVGFVPTSVDLDELDKFYGAWEAAGAKLLMLRPNYHTYYDTMVIPAGFAEHMYKVFQVAYKHGARGADYDSLMGMWPITGLSDYVLARTFSDPDKPFEYWLNHYCSAFGAASGDMKHYFAYWRNEVWNKRLLPNLNKLAGADAHSCNFARNLMPVLDEYYNPEDFDATDAILREAAAKKLTDSQRRKVEAMILANQHARLTYDAAVAEGDEKIIKAKKLLAFRKAHHAEMNLNWMGTFVEEVRFFNGVTGVKEAALFQDYGPPWLPTPRIWNFKMDPDNVGEAEKWQFLTRKQTSEWARNRTDSNWESVASMGVNSELAAQLKNYDGVAWYATQAQLPDAMKGRRILLFFEGVDDSCKVYVNGELAGEKAGGGTEGIGPFTIEISPQVDWNKESQEIIVRVEDKGGDGGITHPPWIVSRKVGEETPKF